MAARSFMMRASKTTVQDRAAGAIMGAMVGDALSLGCHWYYDLDQLKREYGEWINDYTTAKPGHYHYGCKAGDVSQSGQLFQYLLETLNEKEEYSDEDYCQRVDGLLATLDGTREGGRYTQKDMRDVWRNRVVMKKPWEKSASLFGDTTDSFVRAVALAARYHSDFPTLIKKIVSNTRLQYQDQQIQIHSIAYGLTVACLILGVDYKRVTGHLMNYKGIISSTIGSELGRDSDQDVPEPDSLIWTAYAAQAVVNPDLQIKSARNAPQMYGLACAYYMVLPGAYYLAARFPDNFETAVLTAVNSGGQNLARASLTGGMVGAITGLSSFPERFIKGLTDGDKWVEVAKKIAQDGAKK